MTRGVVIMMNTYKTKINAGDLPTLDSCGYEKWINWPREIWWFHVNSFDISGLVEILPIHYLKTQPASNQISLPSYQKVQTLNKMGYWFF